VAIGKAREKFDISKVSAGKEKERGLLSQRPPSERKEIEV
jgi:hypothetical protein